MVKLSRKNDWKFKKFHELTTVELYEILKLRAEVFVVEQDCPYQDIDDKDKVAYHLFLEDTNDVVAYLRILPENVSFDDMAIGRVIVKKSHRGKAISREMINIAIAFIINGLGKTKIRLSGQAYLSEYYESLGFKKVSGCYLEDGIEHFEFLYEA